MTDLQHIWDKYLAIDPTTSQVMVNAKGLALLLGVDAGAVDLMFMFNGRDSNVQRIPQSMLDRGKEVAKRVEQHIGNEGTLVDVLAFLEKNPGGVVRT